MSPFPSSRSESFSRVCLKCTPLLVQLVLATLKNTERDDYHDLHIDEMKSIFKWNHYREMCVSKVRGVFYVVNSH